jgi:hypothetical protein
MSGRKTGLPTITPTAGNNFCRPVPLTTYSAINEGAQCHKVRALTLGDGIDRLCGEKRSLTVTRGGLPEFKDQRHSSLASANYDPNEDRHHDQMCCWPTADECPTLNHSARRISNVAGKSRDSMLAPQLSSGRGASTLVACGC